MIIGGTPFNISSDTYNLGPVSGNKHECVAAFVAADNPSRKQKKNLFTVPHTILIMSSSNHNARHPLHAKCLH